MTVVSLFYSARSEPAIESHTTSSFKPYLPGSEREEEWEGRGERQETRGGKDCSPICILSTLRVRELLRDNKAVAMREHPIGAVHT